jgi:hypothetical protein
MGLFPPKGVAKSPSHQAAASEGEHTVAAAATLSITEAMDLVFGVPRRAQAGKEVEGGKKKRIFN